MHASLNGSPFPFPNSPIILIYRALQGFKNPVSFIFLTLEDDLSWRMLNVRKLMRKSKKCYVFCNNFLHLPGKGLSFLLITEHHSKSLAVHFLHIWRVGWFSSESTGEGGGSRKWSSCIASALSLQNTHKEKKKVPSSLWSQELPGTFEPSCVQWIFSPTYFFYVLTSIISGNSSDSKIFRKSLFFLCSEWDYNLPHCWEETFL